MTIALLVVSGLLLVAIFAIYVLATRRVSHAVGQPTPEEAKIVSDTISRTDQIKVEAEKEKQELRDADETALLDAIRNELRK